MGSIDGTGGTGGDPRHYCTLRKNRTNLNGTANNGMADGDGGDNDGQGSVSPQSEASRVGQYCTIRGSKMGNAVGAADRETAGGRGAFYFGDSEDDRSELNRNLLYEENMCTFENFCEKSLEHHQGEEGNSVDADESVGNFCTLRKKRSPSQKAVDQVNDCDPHGSGASEVRETSLVEGEMGNPIGSYCTLKKKKLKLNQKFVESFLEDPNAKLHDYLSELDAYLDEIDGLDSEGQSDEEVPAVEEAKQEIVKESDGDESGSISYIDVKNFCTLPKRKRVQFLNAFQRAGPLRRTFGGPSSSSSSSSNKAIENGGTLAKREVIAEVDESSSTSAGAASIDRDSVGAENVLLHTSIGMEVDLLHLAVVVAIFGFLYRWITRNNDYFHDKPIPSMAVRPFFGSSGPLLLKKVTFAEFIQSMYNKYLGVKIFGMFETITPFFVIRDPELIKQIGIKDFDYFVDHRPMFGIDNGDTVDNSKGLFRKTLGSMTGQRWKEMRATLSPAFTGSKMRQMFSLMTECCDGMVQHYLERSKGTGRVEVEVKDLFGRVSINVIASCAFGLTVDCFKEQENEFLSQGRKMMGFSRPIVIARMMAMRIFPKLSSRLGIDLLDREQAEYFTQVFRETIKARENHGIVRHDMIDLLLQARKGTLKHQEEKEDQEGFATVQESDMGKVKVTKQLTESEMIAQCLIFFLGGFDTVSTCAMFITYELVRNPEVQQKLYEEVQQTSKELNGKPINYDVLQRMKYMDMVISETLRMWPLAPATDRLCVRDYTIDDGQGLRFTIDKGTCVWFPAAGLHHDPQYFPNPEKFDPERFNDENRRDINLGAYLPFGIGPRNCIGSRFALMEVKAFMYFLLLKFSFERGEKTQIPLQLKKGFTNVGPENGMHVELRVRE